MKKKPTKVAVITPTTPHSQLTDRIALLELVAGGLLQMKDDGILERDHLVQVHTLVSEIAILSSGKALEA